MKTPEFILRFRQRLANARAVVKQIKAGEWVFEFNPLVGQCCRAQRHNKSMWVGNGPFFLDVDDENAFGLLLRHYVWYAAARKARFSEDRKNQRTRRVPDLTN